MKTTHTDVLEIAFEEGGPDSGRPVLCTDSGAAEVQANPTGFARIQWETWSPPGWFDAMEFAKAAESFANPDWALITRNAYRSRWREGEAWDSRYER